VEQLPRSMWHVIGLVMRSWGQPEEKAKFWGHRPPASRRNATDCAIKYLATFSRSFEKFNQLFSGPSTTNL